MSCSEDKSIEKLDELINLVEKLLIVEMALKGFSYNNIRKVVGGDIHRIAKLLKPINRTLKGLKK